MISLGKITLNIGVGAENGKIPKARKLLEKLSGKKAIERKTKKRIPSWGLRKNMVAGVMVTIRGKKAREVLEKCLEASENVVKESSFTPSGNFSFGVKNYIDIPGEKYDPEIGLMGFDVSVTFNKWGYRVSERKIKKTNIPTKHIIKKEEAIEMMKNKYNIEVIK